MSAAVNVHAGSRFKKAQRSKSKLRMAIDGPSGSGKSYTALRFAFALAHALGKGRVAAIDTEHGSLSKYTGEAPDDLPFDFDVLELANFSPTEYTAAIEDAGRAGYDVLVIDSLTHAWQGKDGALELVSKKQGDSRNSFTAWKDVTPLHTRMIEAILASPMHIIVTMRSKTEYVLETNDKGKQEPRRVGMKPVQRDGMEYEFDLYGSMDWSHVLTISKSRCSFLQDAVAVKPGAGFVQPLVEWLETGVQRAQVELKKTFIDDEQLQRIVGLITKMGRSMDKERKECFKRYSVEDLSRLTPDQANDYEQRLIAAKKRADAATPSAATIEAIPTAAPAAIPATVQSATHEVPAGKIHAPDAAPASNKEPLPPKTLQDRDWRELAQLRGAWAATKNISQDDAQAVSAAWKAKLAEHKVETAKAFDFDGYWKLRRELEAEVNAWEAKHRGEQAADITAHVQEGEAAGPQTFQFALADSTRAAGTALGGFPEGHVAPGVVAAK